MKNFFGTPTPSPPLRLPLSKGLDAFPPPPPRPLISRSGSGTAVTFDSYDSYVTYQNTEKFTENLLDPVIKYKGLDNESTIQQLNFILDQLDILDPIAIEEEYDDAIDEVFPSVIGLVYYLSECPYY